MKRDWSIIRDILSAIEANQVRLHWEGLEDDKAKNSVLLHYELLQESGLIVNYTLDSQIDDDGVVTYHPNFFKQQPNVSAIRMTMQGYDMLEVLRDNTLWNKIKNLAKSSSIKLTFEFIKQAIPFVYKNMLN